MIAGPDSSLQDKPARAVRAACVTAGIAPADLDQIATSHPIGMSGARVTLHLALELERRGGGTGVATLCGGGGQGDALLLTVPRQR